MQSQSSMEDLTMDTLSKTYCDHELQQHSSTRLSTKKAIPIVRLRIYCNVTAKFNHENGVLLQEGSILRRQIRIPRPSAIYLNVEKSKTKVIDLREHDEEAKEAIQVQGYELLGIIEQSYNAEKKGVFDVRVLKGRLNQEREIMKSTFINVRERSMSRLALNSENVIKLGRMIYRFTTVKGKKSPNCRWMHTLMEHSPIEQGMCRVCLATQSVHPDCIVAPCACKGTCGHIHIECLRQWLEARMILNRSDRVISYNLDVFHCEICKADLPKYLKVGQQLIELFPLTFEPQNFILLESLGEGEATAFVIPYEGGIQFDVTIGRHELNDLVLDDMSISRRHATLHVKANGKIELSDCNSKFGTFVELQDTVSSLQKITLMNDRFAFHFDLLN